jgi:FkbM family methyltransferase
MKKSNKGDSSSKKIVTIRCSGGTAKAILGPPGQQRKHWARGVFYEHKMLEHIRKTYKGGTWIDIGSALGNHALFFAKFCEYNRILSVEPVESSRGFQYVLLKLNGVAHRVYTIPYALSDYDGTGKMVKFGPGVGQVKLEKGDSIDVTTLDIVTDFYARPPVTLLKLDVEYHELRVLRGAQETLVKWKPAIFLEANTKKEIDAISKFLKQFGYRYVRKWPPANHEYVAKG